MLHCIVKKSPRLNERTPWIYSNELIDFKNKEKAVLGEVVTFSTPDQSITGLATYNKHALISFRVLSWNIDEKIDIDWFENKMNDALSMRESFYPGGHYRWVYGESDHLPGLVIDRYGKIAVVEINTAGMEYLLPLLKQACERFSCIDTWIIKKDSPSRALEQLSDEEICVWGQPLSGWVESCEHDVKFMIDPIDGQKTGWFYDQRENRKKVSNLIQEGFSVCDLFTHTGAFGLYAGKKGATVTMVDRSELALKIAEKNSELNGLKDTKLIVSDVFDYLNTESELFDCVIVDPPAFIKGKKSYASGLMGYKKLLGLACARVKPQGFLCFTSCSYGLSMEDIQEVLKKALSKSRRKGLIIEKLSLGHDHPILPHCPEMDYLKGVIIRMVD